MVREPVVAGQFYEGDESKLREQIKNCFLSDHGPCELPGKAKKGFIKGAIMPHAGYMFSGACAASGYKRIAEAEKADLFIILGPNHTGAGKTSVLVEDFKTPLGVAKVDKEFGESLIKEQDIEDDPRSHKFEHSIEVQIPFLQFIFKDFKFLPIVISSPHYIDSLASAIKKAAKAQVKRLCVIATSDFTHFGYNYGYIPFDKDIKENLHKLDKSAIDKVLNGDIEGFRKYISETRATICGFLPILALMKIVGESKAELLEYYTSGDITGDYSNSVSYASMIFF